MPASRAFTATRSATWRARASLGAVGRVEIEIDQSLATQTAHLDLNRVEVGPGAPVSFIRRQDNATGGLPLGDAERTCSDRSGSRRTGELPKHYRPWRGRKIPG